MKKLFSFEVEQKAQRFLKCETIEDLRHFGFDSNQIVFHSLHPKYFTFDMRKSSGGFRTIEAPEFNLKSLQQQFNFYLQCVYYTVQQPAAFGYIIRVKDQPYLKNILGNAQSHLGSKFMLNADFEDFFHQISSKRVFYILQHSPFQFDKKTASILTRIFTYQGRLPMGAPTSPALSNLATILLDEHLKKWTDDRGIVYTRFVDDLTFSSREATIGLEHFEQIQKICNDHQFKLNTAKTRFYSESTVKKVTGLVLNETIDIDPEFYKELEKDLLRLSYTAEASVIVHKTNRDELLQDFKKEVQGKINFIGMIEGYDSKLFYQYRQKLKAALNPDEEALSMRWINFNYL